MDIASSGDTLWTRVFGGDPNDYWIGYQARALRTGEFLVAGVTDANGSADGFILKTDAAGNEIWRHIYGYSATLLDGFVNVDAGPANTYYCAGTREFTELNGDHFVQRIDSSGAVLWQRSWGGPFSEGGTQVITLTDGQPLVISGNSYADNSQDVRPYLAKLDSADGTFLWQREYGEAAFSTTLFAGKERSDHSLIACGVAYESGDQKGLLLHTTADGDSLWMRTYFYADSLLDNGQGRFYDVLPTADDGYIAVGAVYGPYPAGSTYSQDTWVVKVDSVGCLVPGCQFVSGLTEQVTNRGEALAVYPNPAHGSTNVEVNVPASFAGALRVSLISAQGQVVGEQRVTPGTNTIDLSPCAAGLYYLHLSSGSTWLAGKSVVVE